VDLRTSYLGLELSHPFMAGASPLTTDLARVRALEDAGAAAIVMHSLFEEQIAGEQLAMHHSSAHTAESHVEAVSYMPSPSDFVLGPDEYLEQIHAIREAVSIPVIGSLNGTTLGGWLEYAKLIEDAGADALELNIYYVATDPTHAAADVESRVLEMARAVVESVDIPVSVKLSPFYTALAHLARQLDRAGVRGLVLFNRFYQPDIDVEELDVVPALHLSDSSELLLRLRWLSILSGHTVASLAVTGGVHSALDAIKAIMAGAHAVQMVSTILRNGPERLAVIREDTRQWLIEREYSSLAQMQGSMGLRKCPDPKAFERGNYMKILQSWNRFV
jgi:dihydroorotate dehydrogenase (fumarate)